MWSGFQAKKLNTRGELELAVNQAEPENQAEPKNQAELVPGPDPDQKRKFHIFFPKNQIRHYAHSVHKRTVWSVDICPIKGVYHLWH